MSEPSSPLRIRVQPSARDPDALRFLLHSPVQTGAPAVRFDGPEGPPLAAAIFAVAGVRLIAVDGAAIDVQKDAGARWEDMKAPIAAAIRAALAGTEPPLGAAPDATGGDGDARMLGAVEGLLASRINPSIAKHGGHITAEHVTDGTLYLRMSGGCQGCAASQLTLRGGVERILRAELPDLKGIVDVTDHDTGARPFYRGRTGPSASPLASPRKQTPPDAMPLADQVRRHLEALPPAAPTVSYGTLARALGLWLPGSVRKVTRALEVTMQEDNEAGRPFIAARAVSRAAGLPGKGFFDIARDFARGPREGQADRDFHAGEIARLAAAAAAGSGRPTGDRAGG